MNREKPRVQVIGDAKTALLDSNAHHCVILLTGNDKHRKSHAL